MASALQLRPRDPALLHTLMKRLVLLSFWRSRSVSLCGPLYKWGVPEPRHGPFSTSFACPAVKDFEDQTVAERPAQKLGRPNGPAQKLSRPDEPAQKLDRPGTAPRQPFSVFSAGAAKRRTEKLLGRSERAPEQDTRLSKREKMPVPTEPLQAAEWKRLKEDFFRPSAFEDRMFDQMIASNCDIDVAKSLLSFAAEEGGIGYKLLLKYLTLCVYQERTSEVYDVYDIVRTRFKTLETGGYGLFIKGFSQSDRWRESLSLLEAIKKTMTPSRKNYGDCIRAALHHREAHIAWDLYSEMLSGDLMPNQDTLQAFFDAGRTLTDERFNSELFKVLLYLRDNQVYPGEGFVQSIKAWFQSIPGENWEGRLTDVQNSGQCRSCSRTLESIQLSSEEYSTLKGVILTTVIQGEDTFRKTTPQELQEFQDFVRDRPAFDIVIDGLNVASIARRDCRSQTLLDVVSYLALQNLRLLVLGRKHMLNPSRSWDRRHMSIVQQRAACFFADNMSEDDPFLLYATLHSGNQCKFLTRDLLRDHKACLPDSKISRLFFKWQRGHQLVLPFYTPGKKVIFQPIASYDTVIQTTGNTWHVPYDEDGVQRCSYEVPRKWLCLQRKG